MVSTLKSSNNLRKNYLPSVSFGGNDLNMLAEDREVRLVWRHATSMYLGIKFPNNEFIFFSYFRPPLPFSPEADMIGSYSCLITTYCDALAAHPADCVDHGYYFIILD